MLFCFFPYLISDTGYGCLYPDVAKIHLVPLVRDARWRSIRNAVIRHIIAERKRAERKNWSIKINNIKFICRKIWWIKKISLPLHSQLSNGTLADRLGNGLQNRVEQFDSARYLKVRQVLNDKFKTFFCCLQVCVVVSRSTAVSYSFYLIWCCIFDIKKERSFVESFFLLFPY